MSCAAAPATVSVWKAASDSPLAAETATAAAAGCAQSRASGRVVARATRPSTREYSAVPVEPASGELAACAIDSVSARSPSSA